MKRHNHFPDPQQPQEQRDGDTQRALSPQTRTERNDSAPNGNAGTGADKTFVEFPELMSLALDGQLSESETQQFESDLAHYPKWAEDWAVWQQISEQFACTPAVAPPPDFAHKFEKCLTQRIRRQNLRFGIVVGVLTVLMWLGVVAGSVAVGAYILDQQSVWLGQFVHNITYMLNMIALWGSTFLETLATVLYMPQAWGLALGYLLLVTLVLAVWTQFLRRSTYVLTEA